MNAELVPAAVAAAGGAGLMAAVYVREQRREAVMRASRVRLGLRFPLGMDASSAEAALRGLSGLDEGQELVLELTASEGRLQHAVYAPAVVRPSVEAGFAGALPGLRTEDGAAEPGLATVAVKVYLPSPIVLHHRDVEAGSHALLAAVAGLASDERVVVRWALRAGRPRQLQAPTGTEDQERAVAWRAWQKKLGAAGLRAGGLVLVRAASRARARALADQVVAALRAREERVGALRTTYESAGRSFSSLPRVTRASGWLSLAELLPLLGWPVGEQLVPGLELGGARERLAPRSVPTKGRVLFTARDPRGARAVALSAEAARHHMAVIGPTGVGKSVLLGRCILSDIAAGYGGVLLDPKADLLEDVLDRVPPAQAERIVVLDPADSRPVPGLDLFATGDPDLRADVVLGALAAIFSDSFGIRTQTWGRLALRTLATMPGATLADMGRLFAEESFRRQAVARLSDPLARGQWQAFEALSPASRADQVQSPMAKITALVARPAVRAVLASPDPKLDLSRLLAERRFLMISLSPGGLGEPAARLLGSILMYAVWSAIDSRSALLAGDISPHLTAGERAGQGSVVVLR